MGYRVHFIWLKVNKNLDWKTSILVSVYPPESLINKEKYEYL